VQRNVAEKKILASNWGMKKNSCTEKLPNPPLKYLMVRPYWLRKSKTVGIINCTKSGHIVLVEIRSHCVAYGYVYTCACRIAFRITT
jgi:hypothetical protein